jgi:hypothetical protein
MAEKNDKTPTPMEAAFEDKLARGIAEGVKQALIAVEQAKTAAVEKADKQAEQEAKDNAEIQAARRAACPHCGQPKRGCGFREVTLPDGTKTDNDAEVHERLVARPDNEMFAEFFLGVQLNGVTYFSSSAREPVCTPRAAQVRVFVRNYERHEMEAQIRKNKAPKVPRQVELSA